MKKHTIRYFMWGYQPHFRWSLGFRSREVLDALGVGVETKALLVGVRVPEVSEDHPVCVEPEDGEWDMALFSDCHSRAEEIFENHPDQSILYGDEPRMRDKPEMIRRKSVRQAVEEALAPYDAENATRSFCGMPVRLGNFHVVPVLQVSQAEFDTLPALPSPIRFQDWVSPTGIVHALLEEILSEASEALGKKEPGRYLGHSQVDAPGLLRQAARRFCDAIPLFVQDFMLQGVFDALNGVSALRYEGGETMGEIVFAPAAAGAIDCQITFARPIRLSAHRLVRKLVEMSGDGLACLCTSSDGLSGLAAVECSADSPVFRAVFVGHYCWELRFNDRLLLRCAFGVPEVPRPRLTEAQFSSNACRVIPGMTGQQSRQLWNAVSTAMGQGHGTMFVVSDAAESEAMRLGSQSIPIEPIRLTPLHVQRLSGIDGAILADRECTCYAVGVILDGLATDSGDPSRGARYNSAIRYVNTAEAATLCIVVSEDGYVDMIPTLRPQIDRRELEARVEELRTLTADTYHETRNWLDRHRFYLSAEQCDIVNRELERIHSEPQDVGEIRIVTQPFSSDPNMNESYFLDETPE